VQQEERLTLDLGSSQSVNRARLLPRAGFLATFPTAFTVEASADGNAWTAVASESAYAAQDGVWWERSFTAQSVRYLRLRATNRLYAGSYYCEVAEFEVNLASQQVVRLNWTAPGDNGNSGTAVNYEVRYRVGTAIDGSNWGSSTPVSVGVPMPA